MTNNKIKLLILTPTLQCGGSEKFVTLVCNYINTQIFSVCLIVFDNARPFYQITNPAIEIVDLKKERVLFSLFAIKATAKKFNPDIVFSTASHLNVYLAVFKNHFSKNIKFIAREASIVSINGQQAKFPALYNRLIKKYYNRFDHIVCQSVFMQQDLVGNYHIPAGKTVIIRNAVQEVLSRLQPAQQYTGRSYKFITIARLSQEKGIDRLIHAMALISVPFTYYIIGEGNKRENLQKLINELQLQDKIFYWEKKQTHLSAWKMQTCFCLGRIMKVFLMC